uniref:Myosin heavy chain n=1 Tax=Meloidogyne javanica TaxID=6303 RepID=A0A915LQP6_MELJA
MALPEKFLKDPAWPYLRQSEAKLLTAQHLTSGKKFDPKRSVWIPDPEEGFVAAEIKSTAAPSLSKNGAEMITVVINEKGIERKLAKEEVQPRNPPKFEMSEDMAELTHLNEASVLHNLRQRYANTMIYTYSGLFCVAINPYKRLPIYSESVCKMYIGRRRNEMPPHIFSICDEAYRNMMNEQENQSMLITGESGAGKTENTKKVIGYFAVVGGPSGGSTTRRRKKLYLNRPISNYHFVAQAEVAIEGLDDREEMLITDESFDIMKFTEKEKFEMYALVAAVMHMGEMRFKQRPREEQAEADDVKEGEIACKLFGVDKDAFLTAILRPRVKIGAEWVNKGQNLEQVNFSVGALAKALYARMFAWLIRRCNATLDVRDKQQKEGQHFIGVLDIAGFEIFELNSFEQLWINFVNERLQQFFNHHMFILEQEEYQREGIQWAFIDFGLDLQPCIELIEKEEQLLSNGGTSRFSNSSRTAVKAKKGKSSTFQTVSMIYRQSLANLIKMLNQTHPHFIRCIIPNEQKTAGVIDAGLVLNQLTCNGVLEGIRICRKGFPNRLIKKVHYLDFRQRYAVLAAKEAIEPVSVELAGKRMCERMEREGILNSDSFQCGKTKVFFKTGVLASLEQHRDEALAKIIAEFQRVCRYYLAQKELQRRRAQKAGIKIIQRNVRKWCALRGWNWFKLLGRVRPLIKENQQREDSFAELENINKNYSRLEADFAREEKLRKELEAETERLKAERQQLEIALAREKDRYAEAETHVKRTDGQKAELERQLDRMSEQLAEEEN